MKDLCALLEENTDDLGFLTAEDDSVDDVPFDAALAIAEKKNRRPLFDVDDETTGF